jgi:uncharacterized RDD family membrane protein YckC
MDPSETYCRACGTPSGALNFVPAVAAPGAAVSAPAYVVPVNIYAGFWLRLVAYLIDAAIIGIPLGVLIIAGIAMTGASAAISGNADEDSLKAFLGVFGVMMILSVIAVLIVVAWLYYAYSESSTWQGTLGKRALGLYVTDLNGNRITFGRASGRFFARFITRLIPLGIGFIMAGFTARKQALHDMIASCLVLRRQAVAAWVAPPQRTNQAL